MFSLRSPALRMVIAVAAIVAVAGSEQGLRGDAARLQQGHHQHGRLLQVGEETPAPTTTDVADTVSMAPSSAPETAAPTAIPEEDSGAASWSQTCLLSPATIFVGSVAAALSLV